MGVQNIESRQEGEMVESQRRFQEQRNRDGQQQQGNRPVQTKQCMPNLNKEKEVNQQFQRPTNIAARTQGSKEAVHPSKIGKLVSLRMNCPLDLKMVKVTLL